MTDKCIICLEELHSNIGCITPCGHCFHRECFEALKKNRANNDYSNSDDNNNKLPRCPVCKHKSKKFVDIYLTFEDKENSSRKRSNSVCSLTYSNGEEGEGDDECTDDTTKALASLTSENMRLRKSLHEMKSVSKGQGELLLDVLPRFDELQSKLNTVTKDKERMEKELREVEEENSELLTGWNDIEMKMQMVKIERDELEERLKESKRTNDDLNTKWNELDQKLNKAKKKRKIMESRQEVEMNHVMVQISKCEMEKKELLNLLKKSRAKATSLKRAVKKLKRKHGKESKVSSLICARSEKIRTTIEYS